MNKRLAVSLVAASLLASGAAFAQSTTVQGAHDGARAGGEVGGPVGEIVGGTVGAAVGLGLEIPNAVITSIQARSSVRSWCSERVVVGEPLPATVELRPVPSHTEYRYAVVNDRRVIVEPRTRKVDQDHRLDRRHSNIEPRGAMLPRGFVVNGVAFKAARARRGRA